MFYYSRIKEQSWVYLRKENWQRSGPVQQRGTVENLPLQSWKHYTCFYLFNSSLCQIKYFCVPRNNGWTWNLYANWRHTAPLHTQQNRLVQYSLLSARLMPVLNVKVSANGFKFITIIIISRVHIQVLHPISRWKHPILNFVCNIYFGLK